MRIPGIWLAVALAAAFTLAGVFGIGASVSSARLVGRVAAADSTARVRLAESVILRRDATAAKARAAALEQRADSLAVIADARRTAVAAQVTRSAASSAAAHESIDFSSLPEEVLQAIVDGDDLRIAVTPMLAADSAVIAELHEVVRVKSQTIALQDSALIAQDAAIAAQRVEIAALTRQAHPRCGRRCALTIGVVAAVTARQLPALARRLFSPPLP